MTESVDRFTEIMNSPDPFVARVIHGHLLVEEQLNRILDKHFDKHFDKNFKKKENFSADDLTCYRKIKLAKALHFEEKDDKNWMLIEKINELRNVVAHNVQSPKLESKMDAIEVLVCANGIDRFLKENHPVDFAYHTAWIAFAWAYGFLEKLDQSEPASGG